MEIPKSIFINCPRDLKTMLFEKLKDKITLGELNNFIAYWNLQYCFDDYHYRSMRKASPALQNWFDRWKQNRYKESYPISTELQNEKETLINQNRRIEALNLSDRSALRFMHSIFEGLKDETASFKVMEKLALFEGMRIK